MAVAWSTYLDSSLRDPHPRLRATRPGVSATPDRVRWTAGFLSLFRRASFSREPRRSVAGAIRPGRGSRLMFSVIGPGARTARADDGPSPYPLSHVRVLTRDEIGSCPAVIEAPPPSGRVATSQNGARNRTH